MNQTGLYSVKVFGSCDVVEDSVTINFFEIQKPIGFVANVITPNGDGKNDYFLVEDEAVGSVSILVVNRWGKEVYYSPAYDNNWDGNNLSSGVYFVLLEGACKTKVKGWLTIIR